MKRLNQIITHPLFSGSTIMVIGSNGASAINYLYHLLMGRLLGPSSYGELAALISVIGLLGIIPGSFSLVIVKQISAAKNAKEINNLIGWFKKKIFISALVFSIMALIAAPLISSFLNIHKSYYLVIIAISLLFALQSGFYRAILQGLLKFKEMVISIIFENSIKLTLSILLVLAGLQVGGAIFALLISIFLGWFVTNLFLGHKPKKKIDSLINSRAMLYFAVPVAMQSLAITSLYTSDVILVKHFFPSHEAGIYAAMSTLGKIIFFATGPITTVMFPLISKRSASGQSYKKVFQYSFIITAVSSLIILLFYFLQPMLAINLLFGKAYLESYNLLVWFGIFMSLFTLSTLLINYNLSLGRAKVTIFPTVAAIVQIILIVFYHQNLFSVILISIITTALLLILLLIYSTYGNRSYINNSSLI